MMVADFFIIYEGFAYAKAVSLRAPEYISYKVPILQAFRRSLIVGTMSVPI